MDLQTAMVKSRIVMPDVAQIPGADAVLASAVRAAISLRLVAAQLDSYTAPQRLAAQSIDLEQLRTIADNARDAHARLAGMRNWPAASQASIVELDKAIHLCTSVLDRVDYLTRTMPLTSERHRRAENRRTWTAAAIAAIAAGAALVVVLAFTV
jgi:hypothetical protein